MLKDLKDNWIIVAAIVVLGYYIWQQQQDTASKVAPVGGSTP